MNRILIKELKKYFEKQKDIVLAFVFGSQVSKKTHLSSDWDIGVYFKPEEYMELETVKDYPTENKIWSDLIDILKTDDVDFIVLNRAAPSVVYNVLRTGFPLAIKNKKLYYDLLCKVSYEAIDWWQFVSDFYCIAQKSKSILPEVKQSLLKHLWFLEKEFSEIERIKGISWEDYQYDSFKRKVVERWVENLVMSAIDISQIIIASDKREIPQSYKDILRLFGALYIGFSEEQAEIFSEFAKLRNIVVHEYLDSKWKKIKNFIKYAEKFYPEFIRKVKIFAKVRNTKRK